jgi:hypothetical protein
MIKINDLSSSFYSKTDNSIIVFKLDKAADVLGKNSGILSFLNNIYLWSYDKELDENSFIIKTYDFFKTLPSIYDVSFYREERDIIALIFYRSENKVKYELFDQYIKMLGSNEFNFYAFLIPISHIDDVSRADHVFMDNWKKDDVLTSKYKSMKVFS